MAQEPARTAARSAPSRDGTAGRVADAPADNMVDRYAPAGWRPYLRLMRADRPIGTWLLLIPCWWGLALALAVTEAGAASLADWLRAAWYAVLFAIGATVMRGAGCVLNDIADREIDARVARTASRPIPSGQVSVRQAAGFMVALCLVGLAVLLQFNWLTVAVGAASLLVVAVYPFMKRITHWPQIVLGIAFNWGVLVGFTAWTETFAWPVLLVYLGALCWTVGYDTIYAHQDREDDAIVGVKSTALLFGRHTQPIVAAFYAATCGLLAAAFVLLSVHPVVAFGLAGFAAHLAWQVATVDIEDGDNCLARFRANRDAGLILTAGLLAAAVMNAHG